MFCIESDDVDKGEELSPRGWKLYHSGKYKEAFAKFKKAASIYGNFDAQYTIGYMHHNGDGVDKD